MSLQVYDFGRKDGIQTYRVSGTKQDLNTVLDECYKIKTEFVNDPSITYVRLSLWTMLLKIKVPEIAGECID